MSLRAPPSLLVLLCLLAAPALARADRPTSPARLADTCRQDRDSALCREVRRLCATRAVRDDVVPACKELGWYGDSVYRKITNLCPIDPTHGDCQSTKALCESQRAASIGEDGEKICRELGWGEYAYTNLAPPEDAEGEDDGAASDEDAEGSRAGVVGGLVTAAPPAPVEGGVRLPPGWAAGVQLVGARLGLVDDAARLGGHETLYTAHLDASLISFTRAPLAATLVGDLGATAGGGLVYQADLLVGVGRWWTPHLGAALVGGVGVSALGDARAPFAVDLPVRLVGVAHAGDRVTLEGWAQVAWFASTSAGRSEGSETVGFADAAELGGALVWARRGVANGDFGGGVWLGGLYQEQNGTRIVSIMVGVGAARNPWNQ